MRAKAREDGACAECSQPYAKGDRVMFTRVTHLQCANGHGFKQMPAAPTLEFTRLQALDALEEAVKVAASVNGVDDEMEKQWAVYEKIRERAIRPGAAGEERNAFRLALRRLIDLAF